jgi:peroxiredoxin
MHLPTRSTLKALAPWTLALALAACGAEEEDTTADANNAGNNAATNNAASNNADNNAAGNNAGNNNVANNADNNVANNADNNVANNADNNVAENNEGNNAAVGGGMCASGAQGPNLGQIAPDITLMDCDGNPHSLHELCAYEVAWIFEFAAWCPPCRRFIPEAEAVYQRFAPQGLGAWVVISEAGDFSDPDAELCREVRDQNGLSMTVLFDPEGELQRAFAVPSNDINILLGEGGEITFKDQYASDEIEGVLEDTFAP